MKQNSRLSALWQRTWGWCRETALFRLLLTVLFLGLALGVVLYYVVGPSVAYLNSDCTDSLLWAQATVDSGELLSSEFHYAALLPFGSSLWMVPILQLCGYTMLAHHLSMAVFAVLFVAVAYTTFRSFKWSTVLSAGSTALLCFLLSGSVKLREIMWDHVIYYSLGILLFLLLLNVSLRLFDYVRRWTQGEGGRWFYLRFVLLALALVALCVGCGMDGFQMLVLTAIPLAGGMVAVAVLDHKQPFTSPTTLSKVFAVLSMAVGVLVGLGVLTVITKDGAITAGYESAYSNWDDMSLWWGHIERFLTEYLLLFGVEVVGGTPLFTLDSVFMMAKMAVALLVLVCPLLLLLRYPRLQRESSRLLAWSHGILALILLLGYVCGALSAANWRLTPLVGSGIVATLVYFSELWQGGGLGRRMMVLMTALVVLVAGFNAHAILKMPAGAGENQKYLEVIEVLEDKGYTKGYATFWHAGKTTLLADSEVQVVNVTVDANGVYPYRYQTCDSWYETEEGQDTYFLLLDEGEYTTLLNTDYWYWLHAAHQRVDLLTCEGFHILVFDSNPMA